PDDLLGDAMSPRSGAAGERGASDSPPDRLPFEKSEIEGSIVERFERIVRRFPSRPAVRDGGRPTSYDELNALSDRIASGLGASVQELAAPVTLMMETGAPLLAAMLATLKAGGFYVPLGPGLPAARLEVILRDLEPAAVLTDHQRYDQARALVRGVSPVWRVDELAAIRSD